MDEAGEAEAEGAEVSGRKGGRSRFVSDVSVSSLRFMRIRYILLELLSS